MVFIHHMSDYFYTPLLNLSRTVLACHRPRLISVDIIYVGVIQDYFRKLYFVNIISVNIISVSIRFVDKLSKDIILMVF